ncbi:hypothetical protein ACFC58_33445 [Kitasatospora purpeofusca]|uniref:hypothetical protein n=1 Tax=Kitasatospora purpeofusca TaxID=67352 RepID=UPI0035DFF586
MEKIRTAALAGAAGAVPAVLGLALKWPGWLWGVASAVVVMLTLATAVTRVRPGPHGRPLPEPGVYGPTSSAPDPVPAPAPAPRPEPPVEQPYQRTAVTGVPLPSGVPDYDFIFSATVWWRPISRPGVVAHAAPDTLAIEAVLARARSLTEREHPGRPELVRHRLDGLLGTPVPDSSGIVVAMGGQVGLALPEADRTRLDKLAEVRKAEAIWDNERRYERSKRTYLGDDVLKSPGSAVVWWLARNDDGVQEAVDMIGPLAQLAAAANDQAVDVLYRHLVATAPAGSVDEVPFLDLVAPNVVAGSAAGDSGSGARFGAESAPGSWPGPSSAERGASVVGPLADLMDDLRLEEEDDRIVYAHRVARFTDAAGRPDAAERIRQSLGGDAEGGAVDGEGSGGGDGNPAWGSQQQAEPMGGAGASTQRIFVVGPVQPGAGAASTTGPAGPAWEALRGSVNGGASGTGNAPEEGWGGADQSH